MHDPSGRGQAEGIKRRAKPAILHSRVSGTQIKKGWRNSNDTVSQPINVYVVFKEGEMNFVGEGEKATQWAVIYNVEQQLEKGQRLELTDQNKKFIIRRSVRRPAREPRYFKAWGVEAN